MKGVFLVLLVFLTASCEHPKKGAVRWRIDNTHEVGGNSITVLGNPEVVDREPKKFVEFDGQTDGLLVNANPLRGLEEFTIEVEFKPYKGYLENKEQRFLHIQEPENENRRILIELRLNNKEEWYGDWFIKSENESLTLLDSTKTYPVDAWATISMTYRNGVVRGNVNGKEEVSGRFKYLPLGDNAKTSLGTRMDQRSWFKGAIKEVRFTSEALDK